ncbi:MAG: protein-glutamate O-methyltransferase CheR [Clostridiaceae bacterium]
MAFTYFFRDLQTMETIKEYSLPYLRTRQYIKVWDAGCAMGQEPYSLSMILRENLGHMYFRNVKILATDIDGSDLFKKIIEEGKYSLQDVQRIPKDIFNKYFKEDEDGYFKLNEEIIKSVSFLKHNLLSLKPPQKDFGLIICKNVLLHFNEKQREDVIRMYYDSLIEGGYLAMEQTQKLPKNVAHLFEPIVSNAQVFKKVSKII